MKVRALLLAAALSSSARAGGLEGTLQEIRRAQQQVVTLRAHFVQEKHLTIVRDVLRSSGTFTLDKRGRIVWDVVEPEHVRIVITPEGVFAGGKRITEGGPLSPLPFLQCFTGLFAGFSDATSREFEISQLAADRLRLTPRAQELARWIQVLEITFDSQRRVPTRVVFEEPGGDLTEIGFSDVVVNPVLDEGAFAP